MLHDLAIRCSLTGERETSLPCPPYRRERARTHIHGTLGIIGPIPVDEVGGRLVFSDLFDLVLLNLRWEHTLSGSSTFLERSVLSFSTIVLARSLRLVCSDALDCLEFLLRRGPLG